MFSTYGVITICFLIVTLFSDVQGHHKHVKNGSFISDDFDVLIFTQHWPQTVCFQWKETLPSHKCLLPNINEWTIHGIWPTKYHKIGPLYCNRTLHFNASALAPIEAQLQRQWINIEDDTPHYSFWKHEYEKHGTCAMIVDALNTELKYFSEGLDLLERYSMTKVLSQADIVPGLSYPVKDILDSLEKVLGKNVVVSCIKNSKSGVSYLLEIRICFNKGLELMDCDGVVGFPSNCDHTQPVTYPGKVPTRYHTIQI